MRIERKSREESREREKGKRKRGEERRREEIENREAERAKTRPADRASRKSSPEAACHRFALLSFSLDRTVSNPWTPPPSHPLAVYRTNRDRLSAVRIPRTSDFRILRYRALLRRSADPIRYKLPKRFGVSRYQRRSPTFSVPF